tara:strand:+ start:928 stop:1617 length:690 start_codon:yes stop_codon:yes gene_type:complete
MLKELIKIANDLDELGLTGEADELDKILKEEYVDTPDTPILGEEGAEAHSATQRVRKALKETIGMPHLKTTFVDRNPGGDSEGSVFKEKQTLESLMKAEWLDYSHPNIAPPATGAFITQIPGTLGLIELASLDPATPISMEPGSKGNKPYVTVLVEKEDAPVEATEVEHTILIVGPFQDKEEIVYTFHPGDPIRPSSMRPSEATDNAKTAADAIALGFDYGKIKGIKEE